MGHLDVRIRAATARDQDALMDFYRATETNTLPPPPLHTLRNSLSSGSILLVEAATDAAPLAAGGYFDYIKSTDRYLIFELAGTRVTSRIGRLSPVPLQRILLAIRLFQILATEERKEAMSVISSARHPRSIANLQALRMAEIVNMPGWLEYDICSWTRMDERASWRHFFATADSMQSAFEILEQVEFSRGVFSSCSTVRKRDDGTTEQLEVAISYDLPLCELLPTALAARDRNEVKCNFAPLPERWP